MKAQTQTQLQIVQELERRGCEQKPTKQDEYLKLEGPTVYGILWVDRRGNIRKGRRLPESIGCSGQDWQELKRVAKKNYKQ